MVATITVLQKGHIRIFWLTNNPLPTVHFYSRLPGYSLVPQTATANKFSLLFESFLIQQKNLDHVAGFQKQTFQRLKWNRSIHQRWFKIVQSIWRFVDIHLPPSLPYCLLTSGSNKKAEFQILGHPESSPSFSANPLPRLPIKEDVFSLVQNPCPVCITGHSTRGNPPSRPSTMRVPYLGWIDLFPFGDKRRHTLTLKDRKAHPSVTQMTDNTNNQKFYCPISPRFALSGSPVSGRVRGRRTLPRDFSEMSHLYDRDHYPWGGGQAPRGDAADPRETFGAR